MHHSERCRKTRIVQRYLIFVYLHMYICVSIYLALYLLCIRGVPLTIWPFRISNPKIPSFEYSYTFYFLYLLFLANLAKRKIINIIFLEGQKKWGFIGCWANRLIDATIVLCDRSFDSWLIRIISYGLIVFCKDRLRFNLCADSRLRFTINPSQVSLIIYCITHEISFVSRRDINLSNL